MIFNPVIEDPEIVRGRFKLLRRTDRRFVVHEMEQEAGDFRFGPVFKELNDALWRMYHRVKCEEKLGYGVGDRVYAVDRKGILIDFVARSGELDLRRVECAVRFPDGRVGVYPQYMVRPVAARRDVPRAVASMAAEKPELRRGP